MLVERKENEGRLDTWRGENEGEWDKKNERAKNKRQRKRKMPNCAFLSEDQMACNKDRGAQWTKDLKMNRLPAFRHPNACSGGVSCFPAVAKWPVLAPCTSGLRMPTLTSKLTQVIDGKPEVGRTRRRWGGVESGTGTSNGAETVTAAHTNILILFPTSPLTGVHVNLCQL